MSITKRIRGASKFLGEKFDPQRAADEASIKYITKVGQLSDRLLALQDTSISEEEIDEIDKFLNWSAATWESAIPYFRAQNDNFYAQKIQSYLRIHKKFIYFKHRLNERIKERTDAIDLYRGVRALPPNVKHIDAEVISIEELDTDDDEDIQLENLYPDADLSPDELRLKTLIKTLTSQIHAQIITSHIDGISNTVTVCRYDMLEASKYLIAISFNKDDVESAKTLVMNKPEIQARLTGPPSMTNSREISEMRRDIRRITAHVDQTGRVTSQA